MMSGRSGGGGWMRILPTREDGVWSGVWERTRVTIGSLFRLCVELSNGTPIDTMYLLDIGYMTSCSPIRLDCF